MSNADAEHRQHSVNRLLEQTSFRYIKAGAQLNINNYEIKGIMVQLC